MDSVRGTKSVRLQRRKGSLGFSIKGGIEHGIPIVVSEVEGGGAAGKTQTRAPGGAHLPLSLPLTAAGLLHLGDELVSVNGVSLRGLTHVKVVQQLCSAGHNVVLMVRPNQLLEGGLI